MKKAASSFFAIFIAITCTFAGIGETPDQLKERYGKPVAESADKDGNGLSVYRTKQFKEVRVTFVAGKSQHEKFTVMDGVDAKPILDTLRKENSGRDGFPWDDRTISFDSGEEISELKFVRPKTGQTTKYFGHVRIKKLENHVGVGVLNEGDRVVEIMFSGTDPSLGFIQSGREYSVTVVDQDLADLRDPIVVVGKREHVDWFDAVDDAYDQLQLLVRIESNGMILFDKSICGTHHIAMNLTEVPIAYGMLASTETEIYCDTHFPHFRDYAAGGCLVQEEKTTWVYVCPACVAACKEYARIHPKSEKATRNK